MKHLLPFTQKSNAGQLPNQRRGGQSLIGLLVVVVIAIALYLMFLGPRTGKDGERRPSIARESINRGEDVAMNSNISQIQQVITMYKNDNEGRPPASLEELRKYAKDYPAEMWIDPVSKKPLIYDAASGTISAPPRDGAMPAPNSSTRIEGASPAMPNIPPIPNSSADGASGAESDS